jgi:hypothetical protein
MNETSIQLERVLADCMMNGIHKFSLEQGLLKAAIVLNWTRHFFQF